MHLVPIIQQPKVGVDERTDVAGVAALKPVQTVEKSALPLPVTHHHGQSVKTPVEGAQAESTRPQAIQIARQSERRMLCRRVHHQGILEELRSSKDRRKVQQRRTDMKLHIDEKV